MDMATVIKHVDHKWKQIPYLCASCGSPIDPQSIGEGETAAWCANCKKVCRLPVLKIPGWVAGIIALLLIKLQSGF